MRLPTLTRMAVVNGTEAAARAGEGDEAGRLRGAPAHLGLR